MLAEERLLELSSFLEKPELLKKKFSSKSIGFLFDWYLGLESFKSKASYRRRLCQDKVIKEDTWRRDFSFRDYDQIVGALCF